MHEVAEASVEQWTAYAVGPVPLNLASEVKEKPEQPAGAKS